MQYLIYHATGKDKFFEVAKQPRKLAGIVEADSLNEAYTNSQNIDSVWNPATACRSTSVGDVIVENEVAHLVMGIGYKVIDFADVISL